MKKPGINKGAGSGQTFPAGRGKQDAANAGSRGSKASKYGTTTDPAPVKFPVAQGMNGPLRNDKPCPSGYGDNTGSNVSQGAKG